MNTQELVKQWILENCDCGQCSNEGEDYILVFEDRAWIDTKQLAEYLDSVLAKQ